MPQQVNIGDILDRAAQQHITIQELNILVTTTRELSAIRAFELECLQQLLMELEARRKSH